MSKDNFSNGWVAHKVEFTKPIRFPRANALASKKNLIVYGWVAHKVEFTKPVGFPRANALASKKKFNSIWLGSSAG